MLFASQAKAQGNTTESPFLHTTASVRAAQKLWRERNPRYSDVMVRWPRGACPSGLSMAIRSDDPSARAILNDRQEDSPAVAEAISRASAYGAKDFEVVFFDNPPLSAVDWWDTRERQWRPSSEWEKSCSEALSHASNFLIFTTPF